MDHGNSTINPTHSKLYQGFYRKMFGNLPPHKFTEEEMIALMPKMVFDVPLVSAIQRANEMLAQCKKELDSFLKTIPSYKLDNLQERIRGIEAVIQELLISIRVINAYLVEEGAEETDVPVFLRQGTLKQSLAFIKDFDEPEGFPEAQPEVHEKLAMFREHIDDIGHAINHERFQETASLTEDDSTTEERTALEELVDSLETLVPFRNVVLFRRENPGIQGVCEKIVTCQWTLSTIREYLFDYSRVYAENATPRKTVDRAIKYLASLQADLFNPTNAYKVLAQEMNGTGGRDDNPNMPAGYTYFGQFVSHDITFDPISRLDRQEDPDFLNNYRTPRFDLDSIYGRGPQDQPFMYVPGKPLFILGKAAGSSRNISEKDLPRNAFGHAMIGDPRNDVSVIISQLHLLFLQFHNKVVRALEDNKKGFKGNDLFAEAQRIVTWHYQWVVIHDYLKRLVGEDILYQKIPDPQSATKGKPTITFEYFNWEDRVYMPIEFSAAAYRFGHCIVRNAYDLNERVKDVPLFGEKNNDLRGSRPLRRDWSIQWDHFLEFPDKAAPQYAHKITPKLSPALNQIPMARGHIKSVAEANLLRGASMGLPAGQTLARAMGIEPAVAGNDPLWLYILKEAEKEADGTRLGTMGGHIVAEVLLGLFATDPHSYWYANPRWTPKAEGVITKNDTFELKDLVSYAKDLSG